MHTLNRPEFFAGIDLGGTKIQAILTDREQRVLGEARLATPQDDGVRGVVGGLCAGLEAACAKAEISPADVCAIGVGSPGAVDRTAGTVTGAGNLAGFQGSVPLAQLLSQATGLAVALGNDVGLALDAEAELGIGREVRSFLGLWWGTGIGGGVMLDGQRWLGRGAAGEIGHTVIKRNGARCPCGRRGCLEAYAGRRALELCARKLAARGRSTDLFERMQKKGLDRLTSGTWAKSYAGGDRLARQLLQRAVRAIAQALASATNLLDLDAIVLGGGLGTRLGAPFAEQIAAQMQPALFRPDRPPRLAVSTLGDLAGARGAALLARTSLRFLGQTA